MSKKALTKNYPSFEKREKLNRIRMRLVEIDRKRLREEAKKENISDGDMSNSDFAIWVFISFVLIIFVLRSEQWGSAFNFIVQSLKSNF